MNLRLRRRRFGQLAIASAATAAIGNFAQRATAQTDPLLYGAKLNTNGRRVIIQSLNLTTGQIQDRSSLTLGLILQLTERLSDFTVLPDGTFTLVTAPVTSFITGKPARLSRLISRLTSLRILSTLSGLPDKGAIESLVATKGSKLLSIISLNQGTPPFRLADINRQTGTVSFLADFDLPLNRRFSNLTQSPDGVIYGTSLGSEGTTRLMQIDLANKSLITGKGKPIALAQLSFRGKPLENDLVNLACSPANQLFALADLTYEGVNSLYSVDVETGVMTLLRRFDVNKMTFASA